MTINTEHGKKSPCVTRTFKVIMTSDDRLRDAAARQRVASIGIIGVQDLEYRPRGPKRNLPLNATNNLMATFGAPTHVRILARTSRAAVA